jgi:hypothetical protein
MLHRPVTGTKSRNFFLAVAVLTTRQRCANILVLMTVYAYGTVGPIR